MLEDRDAGLASREVYLISPPTSSSSSDSAWHRTGNAVTTSLPCSSKPSSKDRASPAPPIVPPVGPMSGTTQGRGRYDTDNEYALAKKDIWAAPAQKRLETSTQTVNPTLKPPDPRTLTAIRRGNGGREAPVARTFRESAQVFRQTGAAEDRQRNRSGDTILEFSTGLYSSSDRHMLLRRHSAHPVEPGREGSVGSSGRRCCTSSRARCCARAAARAVDGRGRSP